MQGLVGVRGIDPTIGNLNFRYFVGRQWLLVFHQSITGPKYFENSDEAKNCSLPGKYSILGYIDDRMKINDKFEFLLQYDISATRYNHWRQSNNPIYEYEQENKKEVTNFTPIHLDYNNSDHKFGGLAVTNIKAIVPTGEICYNSFLVGDLGDAGWFYAIGQYDPCVNSWDNNIPADTDNKEVTSVWLYIRVVSTFLRVYASNCLHKKNKSVVECFIFLILCSSC